ncbi:hypothetical protein D3C73_1350040 [compost metagenome]
MQRCARLHLHDAFNRIDGFDAVHALHIHDHVAVGGHRAARQPGQAALDGDLAALPIRIANQGRHLVGGGGSVHDAGHAPRQATPVV